MRTTIDIPDELYRTLKTRAAIDGVTLRMLVQHLIELGLARPSTSRGGNAHRSLPVAIPGAGDPIELSSDDVARLEEQEDIERLAGSS